MKKEKEAQRKLRKEARKMKKAGIKPQQRKEPGIPNQSPFKKELLEQIQNQNEIETRIKAQKKKQAREYLHAKEFSDLLAESAQPQTPKKISYLEQMQTAIQQSDLVLEVLDARDPFRNLYQENFVLENQKQLVLVINKIDLVPLESVLAWHRNFSESHTCILFTNSKYEQLEDLPQNSFGIKALLTAFKGSKTVALIGYPNTGKSSIVNTLADKKAVGVSSMPGTTKSAQEVALEGIQLIDCPPIVHPQPEETKNDPFVSLKTMTDIEGLSDPYTPLQGVLMKVPKEDLMICYAIPTFEDIREFLALVAKKRGKVKNGGTPDYDSAAKIVLYDWASGKVPFYTVP